MKTKAAILRELNKPLTVEEVEIPKLEHGQVLVKVEVSGICHKQLDEITGRLGADKYLPHLLGHEGAGIVKEIGQGVTRVKLGDRVVLCWMDGPGINSKTPTYTKGKEKINAGYVTTFNGYAVVSENRLTPMKKEMPFGAASILGCAVLTGLGVVLRQAKVTPGSTVAVFGVGGIGLNVIQGAVIAKASKIIAVDLKDEKLELAKKLGATHTVNSGKFDPVKKVKELTDGKGVDYGFEATGIPKVMEQAYNATQGKGLTTLLGVPKVAQDTITIDPFPLYTGKRITGSHGGSAVKNEDIPKYIDLYLDGKLKLDELITNRFPLDEINTAFDMMKKGQLLGKAIIEFK